MKALGGTHILSRIVEARRRRVADARLRVPDAVLKRMAQEAEETPSFREALQRPVGTRIIAEIKKASPSAGTLIEDLDVAGLASVYAAAGAVAVSVVTEEDFFHGRLVWVEQVRRTAALPVLRKDFVFDEYQVFESRAVGASAVLLIAAMLETEEIRGLLQLAGELGMDALVEVHDEPELDEALAAGASIVGVNNRDLKTFRVDLNTAERMGARMPEEVLFVAESGIHGRPDVERLASAGADAFLVGEHLVRSPDPGGRLKELM